MPRAKCARDPNSFFQPRAWAIKADHDAAIQISRTSEPAVRLLLSTRVADAKVPNRHRLRVAGGVWAISDNGFAECGSGRRTGIGVSADDRDDGSFPFPLRSH